MSYFQREIFSFFIYSYPTEQIKGWWQIQAQICSLSPHWWTSAMFWVPMAKQFSCPFLSFASMPGILTPDILSKTIFFPFYTLCLGPSFSPMMSHTNYGLMTWLLNLYFPRCSPWVPGLHFHLCLQHIFCNISQHDSLIYNC